MPTKSVNGAQNIWIARDSKDHLVVHFRIFWEVVLDIRRNASESGNVFGCDDDWNIKPAGDADNPAYSVYLWLSCDFGQLVSERLLDFHDDEGAVIGFNK